MGVVFFFFGPLIVFLLAVAWISPLIGLVCLVGAIFCALVIFIPARRMVRAERNRLRVIGAILIPLMAVATIALTIVAVIAFIVAVYFYGSVSEIPKPL